MSSRVCAVEGCEKPYEALGYCLMHYTRLRRGGSLERRCKPKDRLTHSHGYILLRDPDHPLADKHGYVYEHRKVLYDKLDGADPVCRWCGAPLTWSALHGDHLDSDRSNNDPSNIVPSCPGCNRDRARPAAVAAAKLRNGRMLTAFGRTQCVAEWAREVGITPQSLNQRLASGWPVERALHEQRGRFGPRAA